MNNKFVYLAGAMSCYYKENEIEKQERAMEYIKNYYG